MALKGSSRAVFIGEYSPVGFAWSCREERPLSVSFPFSLVHSGKYSKNESSADKGRSTCDCLVKVTGLT